MKLIFLVSLVSALSQVFQPFDSQTPEFEIDLDLPPNARYIHVFESFKTQLEKVENLFLR